MLPKQSHVEASILCQKIEKTYLHIYVQSFQVSSVLSKEHRFYEEVEGDYGWQTHAQVHLVQKA